MYNGSPYTRGSNTPTRQHMLPNKTKLLVSGMCYILLNHRPKVSHRLPLTNTTVIAYSQQLDSKTTLLKTPYNNGICPG